MTRLAALAQRLLPPFVLDLIRRVRRPPFGFFGDYESFDAAATAAAGSYEDPDLVARLVDNQRAALAEPPATVAADRHLHLSFALARAWNPGRPLRVLDFGGGLGEHALDASRLLPDAELSWEVVETPALATAGRREFGSPSLAFHPGLDELEAESFDLIYVSGSLQYVPDAAATWEQLVTLRHDWLCLTRLPLVPRGADAYVVQHARRPDGAVTRYPARLFAEGPLRDRIARTHEVVWEWPMPEAPYSHDVRGLRYAGFLLRPLGR